MDIIKEHRKHIRYACFFLLALFGLIAFILLVTQAKDFKELQDAIKELESSEYVDKHALKAMRDQYTKLVLPFAFNCIFLILGTIFAGGGLYQTYKDGSYKATAVLAALAGIAFAMPLIIESATYIKQIKDMTKGMEDTFGGAPKIEIPSELNAILALGIVGAIFCLISMFVPTDRDLVLKGAGALGFFFIFVAACIAVDKLGGVESEDKTRAVAGMILAIGLIGTALSLLNDEVVTRRPVRHVGTTVSGTQTYSAPKTDPKAELQKLKEMLDAGLITQDEYNAKRSKYIDLL